LRIRWERIVGILLLGVAVYLFRRLGPFVENLLDVVNSDGDYGNPIKAAMLGVMCLAFVAGIKLLVTRKEN
jgi:hypothetical protein